MNVQDCSHHDENVTVQRTAERYKAASKNLSKMITVLGKFTVSVSVIVTVRFKVTVTVRFKVRNLIFTVSIYNFDKRIFQWH